MAVKFLGISDSFGGKLGKEVYRVKVVGNFYFDFVPVKKWNYYLRHLTDWRPELFSGKGELCIEEIVKYYYDHEVPGRSVYGCPEHSSVCIPSGWELNTQLKYQYTGVDPYTASVKMVPPLDAIRKAIAQNTWIFAKTMAHNPHWYTLRKNWVSEFLTFDDFVLFIRVMGDDRPYGKSMYKCMDIDDHFYWSMGAPLSITILINRKKLE